MSAPTGSHRGVCVENRDPSGMGRIRVQVPSALGPGASGWAFPAWAGDDTMIWPIDRLPDPGEGVWVSFESPDRMTWTSVFGPVRNLRTERPEDYISVIVWQLGILPATVPTDIRGVISSPAGTPNPDPQIHMEKSVDQTTWERVDTSPVELNGTFKLTYARPVGEDDWWYRAVFDGTGIFPAVATVPAQVSNSATSIVGPTQVPKWQLPVTFTGTLSAGDGADMVGKPITLWYRTGTTWTEAATGTATTGGAWSISWTLPKNVTDPIGIRATFAGDEIYDESFGPIAEHPAVVVPTSITWTIPPMTVYVSQTITGNITSSYGAPEPERTLDFMIKPSGGQWAVAARPTADASGNFSFVYASSNGICDYKMRFNGSWVFTASESSVSVQANSVTTTVSTPTVETNIYCSTAHTVYGTVTDQTGAAVKYGQVQVQYRRSDSGNTWTNIGAAVTVSATGNWSANHTPDFVGPVEYRGRYLISSDGFYLASDSTAVARTVGLKAMGSLSKGTVTHSSAATSWTAVTGATLYEVYTRAANTGDWSYHSNPTDTSVTISGWSQDSYHEILVYPMRQQAGGDWTYGGNAPVIACHTGHAQVKKTGSFGKQMRPSATNTWRSSDGWGYSGDDVLQGYYTASANNAYGTMSFDGPWFRQWVTDSYGSDVLSNLRFDKTWLYMQRVSGTGTGNAVSLTFYVSPAWAGSGGQPPLAGGTAWGSWLQGDNKWVELTGAAHWGKHVLFNEDVGQGACRSFVIQRNNSSDYSRYRGRGDSGDACDLWLDCSWDFVSVAYLAPKWY